MTPKLMKRILHSLFTLASAAPLVFEDKEGPSKGKLFDIAAGLPQHD